MNDIKNKIIEITTNDLYDEKTKISALNKLKEDISKSSVKTNEVMMNEEIKTVDAYIEKIKKEQEKRIIVKFNILIVACIIVQFVSLGINTITDSNFTNLFIFLLQFNFSFMILIIIRNLLKKENYRKGNVPYAFLLQSLVFLITVLA